MERLGIIRDVFETKIFTDSSKDVEGKNKDNEDESQVKDILLQNWER